jgi:methionyl-tRNA formyltransferase
MRIIVCAKKDLVAAPALNALLAGLASHEVMILYSERTRPQEEVIPELLHLKFLERDLPLRLMMPLIERAGFAAGGRLMTFEELSRHNHLPATTVRDVNGPETQRMIAAYQPDLIISLRFSFIFRKPVIDIPRFGVINVHPGALPHYSGLYAPFWQMLHDEEQLGCTVHFVDEGIDTGPIIAIGRLPFDRTRSMMWHALQLYPLGVRAVLEAVAAFARGGTVIAEPQDPERRKYHRFPTPADFAAFHAKGLKLYDFAEYSSQLAAFMEGAL